jgi:hypothetical protein
VIFGDGSQTLRKLASGGSITTLTLVDDTGASFPFQWATALVANAQGQLYFTDGWRVFKVVVQGTQGTVSLVAGGNPNLSGSIDGDALTQASFSSIYDMTLDAAGNLYVMDDLLLRQITPQGQVRTLAGKAGTNALLDGVGTGASFNDIPYGDSLTATPGGEVYVLDSGFLRKVEAVKAPSTPAKN